MQMKISTRYAAHPNDVEKYSTEQLREHFLIPDLFIKDTISGVYTTNDRLIVGGIHPVSQSLRLETVDQLKAEYFLERREIGIINIGAPATIKVDGETITLANKEALYIGKGAKDVTFEPLASGEAKLYFNSAPAHCSYPTCKIGMNEANIMEMGSENESNHRLIHQLIVNSILPTCQLQMGLTMLKPGSVWNTMPAHTHDRRMEAYFYFDLDEKAAVSHFMGRPQSTRNLWVHNEQAVISPPWSIHSGAGTSNYTFIWGMAGENLDYGDMDKVSPTELR
ncbi:5-dehydro-4-deoxy-D-glucuronate isomerase [Fulvivirgaceae bacterium LMO-SS25]